MNNLINIFRLHCLFVWFLLFIVIVFEASRHCCFELWPFIKMVEIKNSCGAKKRVENRLFRPGLRFVLPTLFSKLLPQISAASQDVDADLLRRSAVSSTGFWRCIPALPSLHLLPDPTHGETLWQARAAFGGLLLFLYQQKPQFWHLKLTIGDVLDSRSVSAALLMFLYAFVIVDTLKTTGTHTQTHTQTHTVGMEAIFSTTFCKWFTENTRDNMYCTSTSFLKQLWKYRVCMSFCFMETQSCE